MGKQALNDTLLTSATGEYLVAAELCQRGWQVCMSPHQPSFDIAAVKGRKVQRVQVKTSARPTRTRGSIRRVIPFFQSAAAPATFTPGRNVTSWFLSALNTGRISSCRSRLPPSQNTTGRLASLNATWRHTFRHGNY